MSMTRTEAADYWTQRRPPYNPRKPCPKCGHHLVTSKHVSFAFTGQGEAIRRTCVRCEYVWDERPRDADAPEGRNR